jgi:hypothetical protein
MIVVPVQQLFKSTSQNSLSIKSVELERRKRSSCLADGELSVLDFYESIYEETITV